MPGIKQQLWNIAGFKKEVIEQCKVDSYHAAIIGTLLLMVGIYATFAWMFFFETVFNNPLISVTGGLFMGLFIVSFDRALIASLSSGSGNLFSLIFRMVLALLFGVFLSQPVILRFYEPEIKREAQLLVDRKLNERKQELQNLYSTDVKALSNRKQEIEDKQAALKRDFDSSTADFKKEMDGTGGSGKIGYSTISKRKEEILKDSKEKYEASLARDNPELARINSSLDSTRDRTNANIESFKKETSQVGTLIQAEALQSLIQKDKTNTLKSRYYLLGIILTLIELSALIAKLFFKTRSYTSKVDFIAEEEEKNSVVNKEIFAAKLDKYKELTLQSELRMIDDFFEKSKTINDAKLNELLREWQAGKDEDYKDYWKKFKKRFIIHD